MSLRTQDLAFGYGARVVGRNVTLEIDAGEVLCLLGPNGAGKTTLFKTMLGLLRPFSGRVLVDGEPLDTWSNRQRARYMAYVPQAHAATFPFSVRDVVLMGRAPHIDPFAAPGPGDIRLAEEALDRLRLLHLADRPYTEISGGERQITLIARALAQQPRLLVMDEPTASLDYGNQMRVLGHVRALAGQGIAVILSTHNPDHAFFCGDRVALLDQSQIVGLGPPDAVLTPEALRQLYDVDVVIGTVPGSEARICAPRAGSANAHPGEEDRFETRE